MNFRKARIEPQISKPNKIVNQLDDFCSRHDNIIALNVCLFINNCSSIGFVLVATRGGIRRGILHISRYLAPNLRAQSLRQTLSFQ